MRKNLMNKIIFFVGSAFLLSPMLAHGNSNVKASDIIVSSIAKPSGGEDRLTENISIKAPDKELLEAAIALKAIKKPKKLPRSDAAIRKAGGNQIEY
jgi:hypothetical protein